MRKLLSFLGTGEYQKTTYCWIERHYPTKFIVEAVAHWLQPDQVLILLTQGARQSNNWAELQERLKSFALVGLDIPDGRRDEEIWRIFNLVTEQAAPGDNLVLEVTHAYRSLPMVLLSVAAFLRAYRQVEVEYILYAPYLSGQEPTPVLDLRLLIDVLDWAQATKNFLETGDARWISARLMHTHRTLYREQIAQPQNLYRAGRELENLTRALHLARPLDVARSSQGLQDVLPQAEEEIQQWATPFSWLLDDLRRQTARLAYPEETTLTEESLRKQLELIEQMVRYRLIVQAIQMAREWLINWAIWYRAGCQAVGSKEWLEGGKRHKVEDELNRAFSPSAKSPVLPAWLDHPDHAAIARQLGNLWARLSDLRNDLAHCGMRQQPRPIATVLESAQDYLQELKQLMQ